MPKPRNSDGTLRRTNRPGLLTNRSVIAHWVESEALRVKQLGMSYQAIAEHIKEVAEGRRAPMVPIPDGLVFPPAYRITTQAVHRAFQRAIVRLPNGEAAEFRKLDSERLDSMLLSLQPGIRKGDPRSIEVAIKILAHKLNSMATSCPPGLKWLVRNSTFWLTNNPRKRRRPLILDA